MRALSVALLPVVLLHLVSSGLSLIQSVVFPIKLLFNLCESLHVPLLITPLSSIKRLEGPMCQGANLASIAFCVH